MTQPEIDRRGEHPVEATVVGATPGAGPIPAMVVGDRRDFFGKRLGAFALAILMLFFLISTYIQSARNGFLLERAAKDRSELISSLEAATVTIARQTEDLRNIRQAFEEQNRLLRDAGIPTVSVMPSGQFRSMPNLTPQPTIAVARASQTPQPRPAAGPVFGPPSNPTKNTGKSKDKGKTSNKNPNSKPKPEKKSTLTPITLDAVCEKTGLICLNSRSLNVEPSGVRRPDTCRSEVRCSGSTTRPGNSLLHSRKPVESSKRK